MATLSDELVCAAPKCRRRDIAVILRGPRGAQVPVCTVCWSRLPESGDTVEACEAVDRFYERLGAAPPERREWPPSSEEESAGRSAGFDHEVPPHDLGPQVLAALAPATARRGVFASGGSA